VGHLSAGENMRTWGRPVIQDGFRTTRGPWTQVNTDPSTGLNDLVQVTTLCQTLLLNLGESPFFANYGIPAQQTIITQVWPDFYVAGTQRQFAQHFASLIISRRQSTFPYYNVNVTTHSGQKLNPQVPIPF
jgi:hypothetical protein